GGRLTVFRGQQQQLFLEDAQLVGLARDAQRHGVANDAVPRQAGRREVLVGDDGLDSQLELRIFPAPNEVVEVFRAPRDGRFNPSPTNWLRNAKTSRKVLFPLAFGPTST